MELLAFALVLWLIFKPRKKKKKVAEKHVDGASCDKLPLNSHSSSHYTTHSVLDRYVDLDNQLRRFRITTMTPSEFHKFYAIGMAMLDIIPIYMPMVWQDEKKNGLSHSRFHENIPEKLLDYSCRFGEWDAGRAVFPYLENRNIYGAQYARTLIRAYHTRERSILLVSRLLSQNGEVSKNEILKKLQDEKKEDLQWAMRFYKGFSVRKDGSKYFVSLCDIK